MQYLKRNVFYLSVFLACAFASESRSKCIFIYKICSCFFSIAQLSLIFLLLIHFDSYYRKRSVNLKSICIWYRITIFALSCSSRATELLHLRVNFAENTAKELIESGGNINAQDNMGKTVLHIACEAGKLILLNITKDTLSAMLTYCFADDANALYTYNQLNSQVMKNSSRPYLKIALMLISKITMVTHHL